MKEIRSKTGLSQYCIKRLLRLTKMILVGCLTLAVNSIFAQSPSQSDLNTSQSNLNKGKQLAFERKKGNCLACHHIEGGTLMGNNGPPLIAMKPRFPDRAKLIQQISDARLKNESTIMPPFGAHGILTKQEIELITDWLLTL